jgi:hypothetical protein
LTEWDARKMLESLTLETQHMKTFIEQVKPDEMLANGAPEGYRAQWSTAQKELGYLLGSIGALSKQPDRLPLALDAYFRMQALDSTLGSVFDGIRKYQNPALADLLQGVLNENGANRDRLRQYLSDLAVDKEQEFQVADKEAQRCRAALLQGPASSTKAKQK